LASVAEMVCMNLWYGQNDHFVHIGIRTGRMDLL